MIILIKYLMKKKITIKETGILIDSYTEETANMDGEKWINWRTIFKCSVPGCKFSIFARIYDKYQTELTEILLTNNGRHDTALAPDSISVDWNYGEKRGRKRSTKIAIITHFAKM